MSLFSVNKFVLDQLSVWPLASENFRSLKAARVKEFTVCGLDVKVQCNPARIRSTLAACQTAAPHSREGCFFCDEYRPAEQIFQNFEGRKGRRYHIQLNPYPIFPDHLVIARDVHTDQSIWHCYVDMLDMAKSLKGYAIFYNGPSCGASKPDHMHFQACPASCLPLVSAVDSKEAEMDYMTEVKDASLYHFKGYARGVFYLKALTSKSIAKLFYRLLDAAQIPAGESEPRFNLFTWYADGEFWSVVVFRNLLRSHHFSAQGEEHYTMSIGCADIAGVFIVPVPEEFDRIDAAVLEETVDEVSMTSASESEVVHRLTRRQKTIDVGIMSGNEISFEIISDGAGVQTVRYSSGRIDYNGVLYDELVFDAVTPSSLFAEASFILYGVTIGVDFHWERRQIQKFAGSLRFIVNGETITAVNRVGVEDYLLSVISSEMKGTASLPLLMAHAVISRSWIMSQLQKRCSPKTCAVPANVPVPDGNTYVRWYDHEDHELFDVCADDHCQRYQGLGNQTFANARAAVDRTWGEVLEYDGKICDARFSKCCGGVSETFGTCWEDTSHPYLVSKPDTPEEGGEDFCNTSDPTVLSQVLNDYDLETKDFFRWEQRYGRDELSELVRRRSGIDFGTVLSLKPLKMGGSGRICLLKIEGSKRSMTVGKELVIRRWLSESHLKSSAFEVDMEGDSFVLKGKGWGHGVGLCQIGAAVMASRGYDYRSILSHYYPGSQLKCL